jgi:hypothetical protein
MPAAAHPIPPADWIAIAAHRLAHRWPHVLPLQLDELAAELWQDETLRRLPAADAADLWLRPVSGEQDRRRA